MKLTPCEPLNEIELRDEDLALAQGGAQVPVRVVDPTPGLDEEALRRLHQLLNQGGFRAI